MSRTGNCYDNAVSELWFSGLKTEALPKGGIHTKVDAHAIVFEHIEAFYNTVRPHTTLGFLALAAFELQSAVNQC